MVESPFNKGNHRCQAAERHVVRIISTILLVILWCPAQASEIRLYAAASLTDVLTEISSRFEKAHSDITIKKSFAGSSILAKQISHGARADIFISADAEWSEYLLARNLLLAPSKRILLSNELVLIAPRASEVSVVMDVGFNFATSFTGHLCTGDTKSVPVGKYAKQSLTYYGWWDSIASRVVGTEDVRTASAFVERGECALGIVYKTDALLSSKVKIVETFPAISHAAIKYPMALTKNANVEAQALWEFLQSDEAKAIFTRYGFAPANE